VPATPADATLQALIDAAWAAHFDDPARIGEFADALLARAPAGSAAQGWGWLHRCWAARFARQAGQAAEAMAQARRLFESLDERRGLACLDDIQLRMRLAGGEAIGELPDVDTMAPQRGPWERLISLYGHFAAADRHSRPDAALTALYRAVGAARDTGHAGAMSNTLAMLGAKHADVSDLEPARAFCAEALALVSGQRPGITWQIAALNLLFVAVEQGDAEAARPLADSIVAEIDQVLPHAVEQAHIGRACWRATRPRRARR
jgi:hypothetical protein